MTEIYVQSYIQSSVNNNKVYFARSMANYGSDKEKECLQTIKDTTGIKDENIINKSLDILKELEETRAFKGIKLFEFEKKHFFPLIDNSNILVAAPLYAPPEKVDKTEEEHRKFTEGVLMEILYSFHKNKTIYIFDEDDQLKEIEWDYIKDERNRLKIYINENTPEEFRELIKKPKIKSIPDPKLIQKDIDTHSKVIRFYEENINVREFIKKFMQTRKGIRPIAIQIRYPKPKAPLVWIPNNNSNRRLLLKDTNIKYLQKNIGVLHFVETIYDLNTLDEKLMDRKINFEFEELKRINPEKIKKANDSNSPITFNKLMKDFKTDAKKRIYESYIIGTSFCFDIDSPKVDNKSVDCFEIWPQFMYIKLEIEKYLDSINKKYNIIFSGNGIYILTESIYFDKIDKYFEFVDNNKIIIEKFNTHFKNYFEKNNTSNNVSIPNIYPNIDKRKKDWWKYDKIPFSYHTKWNRLTIPLPIGNIDLDYIHKYSDIDYVTKKENAIEAIKTIIDNSEWRYNIW